MRSNETRYQCKCRNICMNLSGLSLSPLATYPTSHSSIHSAPSMYTLPTSTVEHPTSYHYTSSPTATTSVSSTMSNTSHPHNHSHLHEPEYPATDSSLRNSMVGYPYGNTGSPSHPSNLSQPVLSQGQPQQQGQTYSPPQNYQTTEADVTYYRNQFRDLGFDESNDGTTFLPVSGCALTMPIGEQISSIMPNSSTPSVMGYHESQSTHSTTHGGYTHSNGHSSRHYQPYPQPSYGSHNSHSGYGSLAAR